MKLINSTPDTDGNAKTRPTKTTGGQYAIRTLDDRQEREGTSDRKTNKRHDTHIYIYHVVSH